MTKWAYAAAAFLTTTLVACAVEKKPPVISSGKTVVEAYVRAWNQHDSVALDSILAPDAIHEDIAQNFRGKGSAEVVKFMRGAVAVEPDFKWQVTNSIEEGRYVALEWTWTATHTGPDPANKSVKNKRISGRGASFAEVENGKIKRFTDYFDMASLFR
ncbi:MAG TPA: ester cyclase [Gemmatimonadaceae bacterium]|nr:ester cyclase [Gemmatimonadaceae bacterium]